MGPYSIDHTLLLVGYNATHWFVKNSWGTGWGNNGYGYITKDPSHDCNIRQYVNLLKIDFGSNPAPYTDPNVMNLTILMTDSYGDGWNGNSFSVRQNNTVLGNFGAGFTSGSSSGLVYIGVNSYSDVQIVVNQLGTKLFEVGFVVRS